jgi:hypothetical protein
MEPTKSRQRHNFAAMPRNGCWSPTSGAILPQCEMSSVLVVIADVFIQQPTQVSAIQHDHVIKQIPSYATNPALRNSVLPGTSEGSAHRLESHCLHGRNGIGAELRVAIEDQEALGLLAILPSLILCETCPATLIIV